MTDKEIIQKSKKALDTMGINYDSGNINVNHTNNELLLDAFPELKDIYSVSFSYKQPDGRGALTSVHVQKETHKLMRVVTRHFTIDIPEELR